jgi:predicted MPP superfamily phosphohydrolase
MNKSKTSSYPLSERLWDTWCILSIIGIWPRFIEPNLLTTTHLKLSIPGLPSALHGFKITQLSDLHFAPRVTNYFFHKLIKAVRSQSPDLITMTGDFLCYGELSDPERLRQLLQSLSAPHGCYAVLGNHDYAQAVSINAAGDYDVLQDNSSSIIKGFKRLFSKTVLTKKTTPQASAIDLNPELIALLKNSPFELLNNRTKIIPVGNTHLNLCGLGEYILGRCQPEQAFANYDPSYPGIILLHNPDGAPLLDQYPGDIVLSGHTHGGQINLPWLWKKLTLMENMQFKKGLKRLNGKWLYISRGVGSVMPFRWFAPPEIVHITLEAAP